MKTPEFLISHTESIFSKCVETMKLKNADYSGSDANAFRNFESVEYFKVTDTKTGMMVRLTDKFMRISHLLKNPPKVKSESLKDSIEDAINYLAIMHAYITSEEEQSETDYTVGEKGETHAVNKVDGWNHDRGGGETSKTSRL